MPFNATPNSYVNVPDFATLNELADYLQLLDKNEALDSKYFDWKKDYEVIPQTADGWGDLCEKLNDLEQEKKSYENLTKWLYDDVYHVCRGRPIPKLRVILILRQAIIHLRSKLNCLINWSNIYFMSY